jgi:phage regulator Rha-like protein
MNELVLIKPIGSKLEPYTTADVVAEYAQVRVDTVNRLIRRHQNDLAEFGNIGFEIRKLPGIGRPEKLYHLNEQQATLLITYLKNTEPVRRFKKALVRGFFEARQELTRREAQRAVKAPVRRSLTDAIRDSGEDERMHGHAFAAYTNLIYKATVGLTAPQLRKAAGADRNADALALLNADQLAEVTRLEAQVCTLLEFGMRYEAIKALVHRTGRGTYQRLATQEG